MGKVWLGGLDSNQDSQIQSLESYQLDDLPAVDNARDILSRDRFREGKGGKQLLEVGPDAEVTELLPDCGQSVGNTMILGKDARSVRYDPAGSLLWSWAAKLGPYGLPA